MKRTHTEADESTDSTAYRPYKRPRTCSPPMPPPPSLAGTRLAYPAGEWPPQSRTSHTVSLLRPCAQQCTTWHDALTAFARLGHGGSVVCKRGDGVTRFVGTVPTLRAWWTRTSSNYQPLIIEENLWSRHPRSPVACLRYAFGTSPNAGALTELHTPGPNSRVMPYAWTTIAPLSSKSPSLRAIASATRMFAQAHRRALPSAGVLDLCWFVDDRTVYIVDCMSRNSTQSI